MTDEAITWRGYHAQLRCLALDAIRHCADYPDDYETPNDWLRETIGGHAWVIYTARNFEVLALASNPDAYTEDFGAPPTVDGGGLNWAALAEAAMLEDATVELGSAQDADDALESVAGGFGHAVYSSLYADACGEQDPHYVTAYGRAGPGDDWARIADADAAEERGATDYARQVLGPFADRIALAAQFAELDTDGTWDPEEWGFAAGLAWLGHGTEAPELFPSQLRSAGDAVLHWVDATTGALSYPPEGAA